MEAWKRVNVAIFHWSGGKGFLLVSLLLAAAPSSAQDGFKTEAHGDWELITKRGNPPLLINALPSNRYARAYCVEEIHNIPIASFGFAESDVAKAREIGLSREFACVAVSCAVVPRNPQKLVAYFAIAVPPTSDTPDDQTGRLSFRLSARSGPFGEVFFKEAKTDDPASNPNFVLDSAASLPHHESKNVYLLVGILVPENFLQLLFGADQLAVDVLAGQFHKDDPKFGPRRLDFRAQAVERAAARFWAECRPYRQAR